MGLQAYTHQTWLTTYFNVFFLIETGFWTQVLTLPNQALYHFSHTTSPFCFGYFGDGILWTICPGWPQTAMLLILVSQVARIIDMSHWQPALCAFLIFNYINILANQKINRI
jgi:hypothetical protein